MWKTIDGKTWQAIGVGVVKRPFFFVDASNGWAARLFIPRGEIVSIIVLEKAKDVSRIGFKERK